VLPYELTARQAPEAGADLKKIETILDGTAPPAEKKVRIRMSSSPHAPGNKNQT
jgi:hypothetical protein